MRRVDELTRKAEILRANEITKDGVCELQSRRVLTHVSAGERLRRPDVQTSRGNSRSDGGFFQAPRSTSQSRSPPDIVVDC